MRILYSGTDFPHGNGEFCQRKAFDLYGVFCFSTPFTYEYNEKMYFGDAGDILITTPGDIVYHGPPKSTESFTNDWMYITPDFCQLLTKYPLPTGTHLHIGRQKTIRSAIKAINTEQALKHDGFEDKVNCILTEMVIDLFRQFQSSAVQTPIAQIERTRAVLVQEPNRNWSLEEMAVISGYSVSRFCALYNSHFGVSPKSDLLALRLEMAQQQLIYTNLSVSDVAESCGFHSVYYFSKFFKKKTGVSPNEYRYHSI